MAGAPTSTDHGWARIDALDAELLRLLDERAGLAVSRTPGLNPAREAQVIRRLLARPAANLSPAVIVRIWRDLMAETLAHPAPSSVTIFGGRDPARMIELARLRFGVACPLSLASKPEAAIAAAKAPGGIGLLPVDGGAPWARLLVEPELRVFAVLPCLNIWGRPQALAVARVAVEPSGDDQTLWVTDVGGPVDAIIEALGVRGLAAGLLAEGGGLRLFILPGYVQPEDQRLIGAPGRLSGVIGAAPAPFDR